MKKVTSFFTTKKYNFKSFYYIFSFSHEVTSRSKYLIEQSSSTKRTKRTYFTTKVKSLSSVDELKIEVRSAKLPQYITRETVDYHALSGPTMSVRKIPLQNIVYQTVKLTEGLLSCHEKVWDDTESLSVATQLLVHAKDLYKFVPEDIVPLDVSVIDLPEVIAKCVKLGDIDGLLGVAASMKRLCAGNLGNMPLVPMNSQSQELYTDILRQYDVARKSSSQITKLNYLRTVNTKILPLLWDDVSYFQAMSMLLSYLHLEVDALDIRIPFTPHTFTVLDSAHREVLKQTKELQLVNWILQTGGRNSGVKVKLWVGLDSRSKPTGFCVVDAMGTNSMGPNRDTIYAKKGVVTGSLADADPSGIAYDAYQELKAELERLFKKYFEKDSLIVNIGHSLGASVAARTYMTQIDMNYSNSYLIGYNGGAISDSVTDYIKKHAVDHVCLVHNKKDVVQYGSKHLLPGVVREYDFIHSGTIGPWNPLFGYSHDPIYHGDMQHLAAILVGTPPQYSFSASDRLRTGILRLLNEGLATWMPGFRAKVITGVLKPDPEEYVKSSLSYITRSSGPPKGIVDYENRDDENRDDENRDVEKKI